MSIDAPWEGGPSILAQLREGGDDIGQVVLSDEHDPELAAAGFGSGSIDGILGHHGASLSRLQSPKERRSRRVTNARERPAPTLFGELVRLAERGTHTERLAVYRSVQDDGLLASIDEVLLEVRAAPEIWAGLEPHARWLVDDARHHGPVKLGVALLGVVGDERDIERVRILARHPDFSRYAVVAMVRLLDDPVDELWDNARATTGWRRIHTVKRLGPRASGRSDVQRWLLLEGWKDAILDDYLALACATGGDLVKALSGDVDEPLLEAACKIFDALSSGGPGPGMDRYVEGSAASAALLAELATRCESLERLDSVGRLRAWLQEERTGTELETRWKNRDELIAACDVILLDPGWEPRVLARFRDGSDRGERLGWRLGVYLGLDLWDELFDRLQKESLASRRIYPLRYDASTDEQRARLVAWAETALPLDRIAAGEDRGARGSTLANGHQVMYALLDPDPAWAPHVSPRLLATALTSPDKTLRILAARVLSATPPSRRTPAIVEQARQVAAEDERPLVQQALKPLLRQLRATRE